MIFRRCSLCMCLIFVSIISCKDNPADTGGPIDPVTPGYHNPFNDNYPLWSPDGLKILYQHWGLKFIYDEKDQNYYHRGDLDSMGLWIMNPDGSDPHMMLNGGFSSYDWSPDGSWIYASVMEGQIFKIPYNNGVVDESNIILLVPGVANVHPRCSPDGEWIIYDKWITDEYGKGGLWIIRNDGYEMRHFVEGHDYSPLKSI